MTRAGTRLVAVIVALFLSTQQSRLFDCNKLAVLSTVSGTITLLLLYGLGEMVYEVVRSLRSRQDKLRAGASLLVAGGVVVGGAGFFTMMTHLCP